MILIVPFAAIVAFVTCLVAAAGHSRRPRLIWPFALSTLLAAPVFVGLPQATFIGFWAMALLGLAIWAAMGTLAGAIAARLTIFVVRRLRSI